MTKHEETEALVLWRCVSTEDDRDCDGTYFLPPVFVLAPNEDEAWNRSSPLVAIPDDCYATGNYEARPATEDEACEWMAALESLPTPPVAGEPEREALAKVLFASKESDHWGDNVQEIAGKCERVADAILAAGYRRQPEPREVTTVEELDALPKWSVVMSDEIAYQRGYDYWDGLGRGWDSGQIDLPAVILYEPSTEATL